MMKKIISISLIVVTVLGCADTSNKKSKTDTMPDSTGVDSENTTKVLREIPTNGDFKIDFSLDSLLLFDSEKALKRVFGENVKRSIRYYPEGMGTYNTTVLFPKSKNEVAFVWEDDSLNFNKLQYIKLSGRHTDWKTKEGITIGTKIKELEALNQKPFIFFGLGWDYSGSINWNDGYLDTRNISGSLAYPDSIMPNEFKGLFGDHEIESSSELAQKAALILGELILRRKD